MRSFQEKESRYYLLVGRLSTINRRSCARHFARAERTISRRCRFARIVCSPVKIAYSAKPKSILIEVLPFACSDPAPVYIGDGIAEELTNALAPLEVLRVVPRTSSFRQRGIDPVREGKVLGVDRVITGCDSIRAGTACVLIRGFRN